MKTHLIEGERFGFKALDRDMTPPCPETCVGEYQFLQLCSREQHVSMTSWGLRSSIDKTTKTSDANLGRTRPFASRTGNLSRDGSRSCVISMSLVSIGASAHVDAAGSTGQMGEIPLRILTSWSIQLIKIGFRTPSHSSSMFIVTYFVLSACILTRSIFGDISWCDSLCQISDLRRNR